MARNKYHTGYELGPEDSDESPLLELYSDPTSLSVVIVKVMPIFVILMMGISYLLGYMQGSGG